MDEKYLENKLNEAVLLLKRCFPYVEYHHERSRAGFNSHKNLMNLIENFIRNLYGDHK